MEPLFKSPGSKTLLAFGCLCLAAVVLFWPVFFQGKVIVPGDIPNSNPFLFTGDTPPPPPHNTLLSDEIEQFHVWHRVVSDSLRTEGHLPLWNPYIFTGQPLVANAQSSLFYPPNLLLRLLSPGVTATVRVFFNLLFAGVFTFLFCRELKISFQGSLLAALTFAFSGPLIVWVGFPLANVLACLPFLAWAGERLLGQKDATRTALLGAGMGLSLLGGHPETTFQVLAVFSFYFLARLFFLEQDLRYKGGVLGSYLAAVVLGAVISGIQLLPFLDFMQQSATFARGGRGSDLGGSVLYSGEWVANLATAVTLVCPNFFGNPLDRSYTWPFTNFQNYNEQSVYFGLVPLALAAGALVAGSKGRQQAIIAVLAIFCIGVAWHLPLFEAISHLPVFSMAPSKRLRLPFVFLAAVLAGFGYDMLVRHLAAEQRENRGFYAVIAVLGATALLFAGVVAMKLTMAAAFPPGTFWHKIFHSVFASRQWRSYLPLFITVAVGLGFFLRNLSPRFARLFPGALIALTLFELCAFGWGYNPAVREADILPAAPAVDFLKKREKEPYRILTTDGYFYPNYGAAYGIADVAGYDAPVFQNCSDIYLAQGGRSVGGQIDSRQQWDPNWPLVDFLNVKYVISPRDLPPEKFRMLFENRYYAIYENLRALPRSYLVYDSQVMVDRTAILHRLVKENPDLRRTVILEEPLQQPLEAVPGSPAAGSVEHARFSPDEVVVRVTSDRPGILVMSDLHTPDWTARVDDRPARLYRANYAYRAVAVPQGVHVVTFRYAPGSYRIGTAMTLAGVFILAGIGAMNLLGRRKSG